MHQQAAPIEIYIKKEKRKNPPYLQSLCQTFDSTVSGLLSRFTVVLHLSPLLWNNRCECVQGWLHVDGCLQESSSVPEPGNQGGVIHGANRRGTRTVGQQAWKRKSYIFIV